MPKTLTDEYLAARLENIVSGSARLYRLDFLGRLWLADYVADVDAVCDELRRLRSAVVP